MLLINQHSFILSYHELHAWKEISLAHLISSLSAKLVIGKAHAREEQIDSVRNYALGHLLKATQS